MILALTFNIFFFQNIYETLKLLRAISKIAIFIM